MGEPTVDQTIEILRGLRDRYEAHHRVKISDEAQLRCCTVRKVYTGQIFT